MVPAPKLPTGLLCLVVACAAALGCDDAELELGDETFRTTPYADDPAVFGPHCTMEEDFFRPEDLAAATPEIPARVFYPVNCVEGAMPLDTPLVLFHVANGGVPGWDYDYGYDTYQYIGEHLASHGFMVAVIAPHTGGLPADKPERVTRRAELTLEYLDHLMSNWWLAFAIDTDSLAMAGHSQGGEAAIIAAKQVDEGALPYNVDAVISLAPSQFTDTELSYWATPFFFALYGSRDDDIMGRPQTDPPNVPTAPMSTAFAHYDRFGTESNPFFFDDCVTKAMKFVHGWNHKNFGEVPVTTEQTKIASGYMNAALRWQILGQVDFQKWVVGNDIPPSQDDGSVAAFSQYQHGEWMSRRVIDNFENPWLETNTMGGAVTHFGDGDLVYGEWAWAEDQSVPHGDTHIMVMDPDFIGDRLSWEIPPAEGDVHKFDVLSLRAGQVVGHGVPEAKSLSVRIKSNGQWSSYLQTSSYAEIPAPHVVDLPTALPPGDYTKSPMVTIRVPLADFGVDLYDVEEVELYYGTIATIGTRWMLDNLEFSR